MAWKRNWYDGGMDPTVKIIAFGSATQDVFLSGKALTAKRDVRTKDWVEQFPLGAKIDLDGIAFETGGGASNAAVTFARQGLSSHFAGKVGKDPAGDEVLRVLRGEGVNTDLAAEDTRHNTGYSTVLLAPGGERTVLSYRGASHHLQASDFPIKNIRADWFYISSLAGNFDLLKRLLKHANTHEIRVALNPGALELTKPKKLRALLPLVTVLIANRQEMAQLFNGANPRDLVLTAGRLCQYVAMTDGPSGSYATDGINFYTAGQYLNVKVVDRTGAGDAYGSGFVAGLSKGLQVEDALTLANANATSVVQQIGAKPGILKSTKLKRMKITATEL